MTVTSKQLKALFGAPAAMDLIFVPMPRNAVEAVFANIEDEDNWRGVNVVFDMIGRERRGKAKPTQCLLCTANFLRAYPAAIAILKPTTRKGPSTALLLCEACVARTDVVGAVRATLHKHLGTQAATWGTA